MDGLLPVRYIVPSMLFYLESKLCGLRCAVDYSEADAMLFTRHEIATNPNKYFQAELTWDTCMLGTFGKDTHHEQQGKDTFSGFSFALSDTTSRDSLCRNQEEEESRPAIMVPHQCRTRSRTRFRP